MRIVRTTDAAFIKAAFDEEDCRPWMRDDGVTDDWQPALAPSIYYLAPMTEVHDEGGLSEEPMGLMLFTPKNAILWNPHIAIHPKYRGFGTQALRAGIGWMFANTPCMRMECFPPLYNPRMIRVFQKLGFQVEGHSPRSILHNGRLFDRLMMGLEKERFHVETA